MSKMKCRTCLLLVKPNSSLPLTTRMTFGQTVEEVLSFFIPEMVKSNIIDEYICSRCYYSIKILASFVKKFIDVENYFRKEVSKLNQEQQKDAEKSVNGDIIDEKWPQTSDVSKRKTNYANLGNKFREQLNELLTDKEKLKEGLHLPFKEDAKPQKINFCTEKDPEAASQIEPFESQNYQNTNATPCTIYSEEQQAIVGYNIVEENKGNIIYESSEEDILLDNFIDINNIKCTNHSSEKDDLKDLDSTPSLKQETGRNEESIEKPFIFGSYPHIEVGEINADVIEANSNVTLMRKIHREFANIPASRKRMISVDISDELNIGDLIEEYSQYKINLMTLTSLREEGPKRLLFLGRALWGCLKCGKILSSKRSVNRHMMKAHSSSKLLNNCPMCDQKFRTQFNLENHIITEHQEAYLYKCDKCGTKFKRKMTYQLHMKSFKLYQDCTVKKCGDCGELIRRDMFMKHRRTHQIIKCDVCGIRLGSHYKLKQHQSRHHKNETDELDQKPEEQDLCPVCEVMAAIPKSSESDPLTSKVPPGSFRTGKLMNSAHLKTHMASHKERSFLCDKCPKAFRWKNHLIKHSESVHIGSRYECSLCEAKLKTSSSLRSHLRLKHLQEYSYVCNVCGEGFTRTDYFKRHMARHASGQRIVCRKYRYGSQTADKVFPCRFCNLKFNHIQKLRGHLLRRHIKHNKRSKCRYCGLTFANDSNRIRHEKRHKNPKAFELTCNVCYNRFCSKEELDIHFAKHADSQRRVCEICGETFPSKFFLHHHMGENHYDKETLDNKKTILLSEGLSDVLL